MQLFLPMLLFSLQQRENYNEGPMLARVYINLRLEIEKRQGCHTNYHLQETSRHLPLP
jgi:hypothetical protein